MLVCDRCESCVHPACSSIPVHQGPWYCMKCRSHIIINGPTDITEDLPLLEFLFAGRIPPDDILYSRVRRLATVFRARGRELQVRVRTPVETLIWVDVPPVPLR